MGRASVQSDLEFLPGCSNVTNTCLKTAPLIQHVCRATIGGVHREHGCKNRSGFGMIPLQPMQLP